MKIITIGADPEFFVRRNGHWMSGHGFKCGTKKEPMQTKHGSIQVDGVALECNVKPAAEKHEFVANVSGVISDLREFVKAKDKLCEIIPQPAVFFGVVKLAQLPEEVRRLGCDPDYNAYTMSLNIPPKSDKLRTGAGHIHVGWTENANPRTVAHMHKCAAIVKQLDFYLGMPSLQWEKDPLRRRLYGQAGAFRPKPYGLEYRVLGNSWCASPKYAGFIFDRTVKAIRDLDGGLNMFREYKNLAKDAINMNSQQWRHTFPQLAKELLTGL